MTENLILDSALTWAHGGFSVIPIGADGTKRPVVKWTEFQSRRALDSELTSWFGPNPGWGIGIVCGATSGNLELLELECEAVEPAMWDQVCGELEKDPEAYALWDQLTGQGFCEWSPSGGMHLLYRVADGPVPGNTKLATRPATPEDLAAAPQSKFTTLAETRGEGGYVIVAPTRGAVHETGLSWDVIAGQIAVVPTITMDLRNRLHAAVTRALHVEPVRPALPPRPPAPVRQRPSEGVSPGDDFNIRASWPEILEPHGWTQSPRQGDKGETLWVRPGKHWTRGHAASTGYTGDADRLYVWSSSAGFPIEEPLNKFHVYTELNHGGDYSAAARELSRLGYGTRTVQAVNTVNPAWDLAVQENWTPAPANPVAGSVPQPVDLVGYETWDQKGTGERAARLMGAGFRWGAEQAKWFQYRGRQWALRHNGAEVNQGLSPILDAMRERANVELAQEEAAEDSLDKKRRVAIARQRLAKVDALRTERAIAGVVKLFSQQPGINVSSADFDRDLHLLNLRNGTFNLNTGVLQPHDPRDMITRVFEAKYDPAAVCPRWEQFLTDVLPDPEVRAYVQRALGYTLTGKADQRALMQLYGPSSTGKSQFINVIQHLFGSYARNAEPGTFRQKANAGGASPEIHSLRGGRFISMSETSEGARMDEESLKRITGADLITSRGLYESLQEWRPEGVVWMATNFPPSYNSDDTAIWNRVKPIEFKTRFSARGEPDANGNPTRKWTANIYQQLIEEAPGILNWMLEGLRQFDELGELGEPGAVTRAVQAQRDDSDMAIQFMDEALREDLLVADPDGRVEAKLLYRMFVASCETNRVPPLGRRRFTNRMLNRYSQVRSNGQTYWLGVSATGHHGVLGTMT